MRVPYSRMARFISVAAAADRLLRLSSVYVYVDQLDGQQGMVDESIALYEEMHTHL
jgi:hypothetical protein